MLDKQRTLLGPNVSGKQSCMVLDLDETLVHSSKEPIHTYDFKCLVKAGGRKYTLYVKKRPGVDYFLKEMSKHYELVVFTAGLKAYADKVLDWLDPKGLISYRLYRQHCTRQNKVYVKDLNLLGRPLDKTHIIDNSPTAYGMHHSWAVPITSWFHDPKDTELLDMIPFLRNLCRIPKVNSVLDGTNSWKITHKKLLHHMKELDIKRYSCIKYLLAKIRDKLLY